MPLSHWLVKSEPGTYSWERFVAEGGARWDGVRNPSARRNLTGMGKGDPVLFYHSGEGKAVVGLAKVAKESYPDPTAEDPRWVAVDLSPVRPFVQPVTLAEIKADPSLRHIALVRQSRLSVMPLDAKAFARILALGRTKP